MCGNESQQGLKLVEKLSTPLSDDLNSGLYDKKSSHFEVNQLNGWIFCEAPFSWRNVDGWEGHSPTRDTLLGEPTFHTFPYCAFKKHANSKVQMPPSQLRFTLPSIIITITSNKPSNTGTHKTDRIPPITNHKPWPFELVEVNFCFLRGPLRRLTAAKNANFSWPLNFRICVFLKSAVKRRGGRLHEKAGSARVTLPAGLTFLHTNTMPRTAGSTRSRHDNQSMRDLNWLDREGEPSTQDRFSSYNQGLRVT